MSGVQLAYANMAADAAEDYLKGRLNHANAEIEKANGIISEKNNEIARCYEIMSHVFAQRNALQQYLINLTGDANLPIVTDQTLRERIGNAGESAFNITKDFESAKHAGDTFKVPVEVSLKNYVSVALYNERTELCNERTRLCNERDRKITSLEQDISVLQIALDDARSQITQLNQAVENGSAQNEETELKIGRLVRDCCHQMAQSAAFRHHLAAADPENPLITDGGLRQRLADAAFTQLALSDFKDWEVVREVGRTFALPRDRAVERG